MCFEGKVLRFPKRLKVKKKLLSVQNIFKAYSIQTSHHQTKNKFIKTIKQLLLKQAQLHGHLSWLSIPGVWKKPQLSSTWTKKSKLTKPDLTKDNKTSISKTPNSTYNQYLFIFKKCNLNIRSKLIQQNPIKQPN